MYTEFIPVIFKEKWRLHLHIGFVPESYPEKNLKAWSSKIYGSSGF